MDSASRLSPFLSLGFRPFFLGAGMFAVLSMSLWSAIYLLQLPVQIQTITAFEWHAHEMFFGYTFAVIAGFLLTSVRTWTKLDTAHNGSLLYLFLLWLGARFCFLFGSEYILLAAGFDILFALSLSYILSQRIFKARQWKQLAIISKLLLITLCNIAFYLGALGYLEQGIMWGIYGSLYMVIALILIMGRRVIPFFIERAANDGTTLFNSRLVDICSMLFFVIFIINEVFFHDMTVSGYLTLALFLLNAFRLVRWFHPVIWQQSLLWSIYLAFWMITLGFAFIALPHFIPALMIPKHLAIHAFTVGGIGMITLGMMSRVALGHTGRNVYNPPKAIAYALAAILLSAVIRVFLPLLNIWPYELLVALSQGLWITAFLIFSATYWPILTKAAKT